MTRILVVPALCLMLMSDTLTAPQSSLVKHARAKSLQRTSDRASASVRDPPQHCNGASTLARLHTVTLRLLPWDLLRARLLLPHLCQPPPGRCSAELHARRCLLKLLLCRSGVV